MSLNGYPSKVIYNIQAHTVNLRNSFGMGPVIRSNCDGDAGRVLYLQLPYVGARSEGIAKSLNNCINKICNSECRINVSYNKRKIGNLFNFKDIYNISHEHNVVYKIDCPECNSSYIGETSRRFGDRFREHLEESFGGQKGVMYCHGLESGHKEPVLGMNCKILDKESNFYKRKIRESILINKYGSNLNKNDSSYKLQLF